MAINDSWTGRCACGAIRYEIEGAPIRMHDCQCRDCQRDSGAGHASHLSFSDAVVRLTGTATLYELAGEGGKSKARAFCPTCGSPVYMTFPDMPQMVGVCAASLDAPERYRPEMVMWTERAQPWDRTDPALPHHPRMAP